MDVYVVYYADGTNFTNFSPATVNTLKNMGLIVHVKDEIYTSGQSRVYAHYYRKAD